MEISCFEKIISIDSFAYKLAIDAHEACRFSLSLSVEEEPSCVSQLGQACELKDDTGFHFKGIITEISVEKGVGHLTVDVLVQGETVKYDKERKCRVFQDCEKKASDIFAIVNMSEVTYKAENDDIVSEIVIQDRETDWSFAKRIAQALGKHIFPGKSAWIGDPLNNTVEIDDEDIVSAKYTLSETGGVCRTRVKKKLDFGTRTRMCGLDFFVAEISYSKVDEAYIYEYSLASDASDCPAEKEYFYTLRAKATDNQDTDKLGRIKVEFLEPYEDAMKDRAMWIPCYTAWASKQFGVACVPLVDDVVLVRICGCDAYIISEIRESPFDERFENPQTRYIFLGEQTHISIDEDRIFLTNSKLKGEIDKSGARLEFGDNTRISIEDGSTLVETEKCVIKAEKDRVFISADSDKVELSGGMKLKVKELSAEIAKKASITATNVDIKGKSGVSIN